MAVRHFLFMCFTAMFLVCCVTSYSKQPNCKKLSGPCQIAQDCCEGCCLDGSCALDDMCAPKCEETSCRPDEVCYLQVVQCFTTPCYPIVTCQPRLTCALLLCAPGKFCIDTPGEHAKCV